MISQEDLIEQYRGAKKAKTYFHLAKTPIKDHSKHILQSKNQLYAWGFNAGGRPNGFWVARGLEWLEFTQVLKNNTYPPCCYIYKIDVNAKSKILKIKSNKDFDEFDKKFQSYWLNLDYYDVDYTDYLTGKLIYRPHKYNLDYNRLDSREDEPLYDVLVRNKIILKDKKTAINECEFYRTCGIPIERFKHKNWADVARNYHGIIFDNYDKENKKLMYYLWFQTLDTNSGCIWDVNAVSKVELEYVKYDVSTWKKIK